MDVVKKLVSGRMRAHAAGQVTHLDADTLSAFRENAVSSSDRERIVGHLEQCSDCREVLFLSLPEQEQPQTVLALAPRRSQFAFRWGSLAAAVAIGVVLLVSTRHKQKGVELDSAKRAKPVPAASRQMAKETPPPEFDKIRSAPENSAAPRAGAAEKKAVPTPKHATGKPETAVAFGASDQVSLASPAAPSVEVRNETASALPGRNDAPAIGAPSEERAKQTLDRDAFTPAFNGTVGGPLHGASSSVRKGLLAGSVADASGASVANAVVTTTGPLGTQTVLSDGAGRFSFDDLTAGKYTVRAQASGFKTYEVPQIAVADNKMADVRLTLEPGSVSETVAVTAQAAMPVVSNSMELEVASNKVAAKSKDSARAASLKPAPIGALTKSYAVPILQWTLSPEGQVERSMDLGRTWQVVSVPGGGLFRALSSVGTQVWAGGKQGLLVHSPDSGQSWNRVTPNISDRTLSADVIRIDFSDASSGTLSTSDGEIWVTADAGQTWHKR